VSEGREVYVRARGKRPARVIAALVAMQVEGGELCAPNVVHEKTTTLTQLFTPSPPLNRRESSPNPSRRLLPPSSQNKTKNIRPPHLFQPHLLPMASDSRIRDVWAQNINEEFATIRRVLLQYN
jgi:hypothetical protein